MRRRCQCSPGGRAAGAARTLELCWLTAGGRATPFGPGLWRWSPVPRAPRRPPVQRSSCSCAPQCLISTQHSTGGEDAHRGRHRRQKCRTGGASWARARARQVAQAAANAPAAADGVGQYLLLLPVVEALGEYERLLGRCRALNPEPYITHATGLCSVSFAVQPDAAASGRAPGRRSGRPGRCRRRHHPASPQARSG